MYDVAGRYRYRYTTEYLSDWPAQISHESVMWTHLSINVGELHVESLAHNGPPFPSQAGQLQHKEHNQFTQSTYIDSIRPKSATIFVKKRGNYKACRQWAKIVRQSPV